MRKTGIAYWIATGFVVLIMSVSGLLAITHNSRFMEALAHLGYPPYFANLLGAGKLAGVAVLLAPKLGRLKEWAYAAFGVVVLSACYSHFSSGDGILALDPLATFAALVVSYVRRPPSRRPDWPVLQNRPLSPGGLGPVDHQGMIDKVSGSAISENEKPAIAIGPKGIFDASRVSTEVTSSGGANR